MFNNKKKIELDNDEKRILFHALIEYRNELLVENMFVNEITDVNKIISKLKNKIKVDRGEMTLILEGLVKKRNLMKSQNEDITLITELLLRLGEIYETF